jgi:hypothetical protein
VVLIYRSKLSKILAIREEITKKIVIDALPSIATCHEEISEDQEENLER